MYPSTTTLPTSTDLKPQVIVNGGISTNDSNLRPASITEIKLVDANYNGQNNGIDLIHSPQQLHHYQVIPQTHFPSQQTQPIEYVRVLQGGEQKFLEQSHLEIVDGRSIEMEPSSSSNGSRRLNTSINDSNKPSGLDVILFKIIFFKTYF